MHPTRTRWRGAGRRAAVCIALAVIGATAPAGEGGEAPPAAVFDGVLLETVGVHHFALGTGNDLTPREGGAVRLFVPRVHPAAHNASSAWLTSGPAGRHPLLDGAARTETYQSVILEWLGGTHSPETADVVQVARRLLEGLGTEATIGDAARRLHDRSSALPAHERRALVESLEDLDPWGDDLPAADAIANRTLEVFVASALHHGRVRARIDAAGDVVDGSGLEVDPAFARAYDVATLNLERRRARQRLVLKDKMRFHADNPSDETLRETRVPLLPLAAVTAAFPTFDDGERFRLAVDHGLNLPVRASIDGFLALESALAAITTIERFLYGGRPFEAGCAGASATGAGPRDASATDASATDAWRLRAALGRYAYELLENVYATFDARFFVEALDWPTEAETHAAFLSRVAARRTALDEALLACAALTPASISRAGSDAAPAGGAPAPRSARLETLVDWMTGSFSSAEQAAADSTYFDIRLETMRIWTERTDGAWLYVEQAAAAHRDRPYRQRIYRVVEAERGGFTSEVYTLPAPEGFAGAWREPERFDVLEPDSLEEREGCAVHLRWTGDRFTGGTLGEDCASTLAGASHATSEVVLLEDRIETWDRGFDAHGDQVWGAGAGGYVFRKLRRPNDP